MQEKSALLERLQPFVTFVGSAPRHDTHSQLLALRDILERTGLKTFDLVGTEAISELRKTLLFWSGYQNSKWEKKTESNSSCQTTAEMGNVTTDDLRKAARSILKMPLLRECLSVGSAGNSSSTVGKSSHIVQKAPERSKSSTSITSLSDTDQSTEQEQPEKKRRKPDKVLSPSEMKKIHEQTASKALRNDRVPGEYFAYPMPLHYMCRRPELRWEWTDARSRYRQALIGGGTNSDLENF
eukprot:GEMP01051948.1.p1 GENE.GEMP01051948.1~~GEMP01051948.1.p1  ORF type:complete len:240 (+),score=43.39 GEMP01051948.1:145-864(+)